MSSQLQQLAQPFEKRLIERKPGKRGGEYVTHSVVTERLLQIVGPFDYELVQIVRGAAPAMTDKQGVITHDAREDAVLGVVARLTATVDGAQHSVEEVGSEDNPAMNTDAANLKNAMSDALKRCAMRFGLGLHLWSQEMYSLDKTASAEPGKPVTLSDKQADDTIRYLAKHNAGNPAAFATLMLGRDVEAIADLTMDEARQVMREAKEAFDKEKAEAT